jgi:hypothetical protein
VRGDFRQRPGKIRGDRRLFVVARRDAAQHPAQGLGQINLRDRSRDCGNGRGPRCPGSCALRPTFSHTASYGCNQTIGGSEVPDSRHSSGFAGLAGVRPRTSGQCGRKSRCTRALCVRGGAADLAFGGSLAPLIVGHK